MSNMGATSTPNALRNLFELAADHMEPEQLQWVARLTEFAQMEAENLSATLNTLAIFHENDENGWMGEGEVVKILYGASYQVSTLAALIDIATRAEDRLNNPEPFEKIKKAKEKANQSVTEQFVTATNWANYSLDVCSNRYRFIDKATQEMLLQFVAASDDEAEEICTDFLRRRGMQAQKKKPD
jgi:predicted RND superfamily exporter protein